MATRSVWPLLNQIIADLENAGVGLRLSPAKTVSSDGDECSGFFDETPGRETITVAVGSPMWVENLAHEWGHFQQWLEGGDTETDEAYERFDPGNKPLAKADIRLIQACELDAEKRAFRLLKSHRVLTPSRERVFVQEANAYVAYYEAIRRFGKWGTGVFPREVPEIVRSQPRRWLRPSEFGILSPTVLELYRDRVLTPSKIDSEA